jgi:hypothetical protein|nr:MAG TPA: hypothetical protein [Caudoviricetes sp.]
MTKLLQASNHQLILEDVEFAFKPNFAGREERYNRAGDRYFNVVVSEEDAQILAEQYGVNVKLWEPKPRDDEMAKKMAENPDMYQPFYYFKVKVYTKFAIPSIALIYDNDGEVCDVDDPVCAQNRQFLTEDQFQLIDEMEMQCVDMTIRRREPSDEGTYARLDLKNAYIHVAPNPLERKYGY